MSSFTMKSSPKCSKALVKGWKPLYSPLYARSSSPVTTCMSVKALALAALATAGLSPRRRRARRPQPPRALPGIPAQSLASSASRSDKRFPHSASSKWPWSDCKAVFVRIALRSLRSSGL
jgi:hypothetical protein